MASMAYLSTLLLLLGLACSAAAAGYSALNAIALGVWRLPQRTPPDTALPPVTLLKPLCGAEPGLYEDLRSFCRQDYPDYQIVFGIRDASDPACAIARRLAAEFPSLPISVVVDSKLHGSNWKVSNLINMLPHALHDFLVMADSDACVEADYLRLVTPPLSDSRIGLVTCLYRGIPTPGMWSRIGAMYINEWYVPSVLLAWLFGYQGYVSGQTICIRRATLRAIGGFEMLADQLADDHRLGTLVRALGLRIVLSRHVVSGKHHEPSLGSVVRHEVRWMRTLRVLQPRCFLGLFLTFSLPLAVLGLVLTAAVSGHTALVSTSRLLFAVTVLLRLVVHVGHRVPVRGPLLSDLWLLPLRDVLLGWVWLQCFFTSTVTWRGNDFSVDANGVMHRLSRS
jgi:ceramide glucosyltransferase